MKAPPKRTIVRTLEEARLAIAGGKLTRAHRLIRPLAAGAGQGDLPVPLRHLIDALIQAQNAALIKKRGRPNRLN